MTMTVTTKTLGKCCPWFAEVASSSLSSARGILRTLLGLALGLGVAVVAGYLLGVKPHDAMAYASGISPWAIVACAVSSFAVLAFQALRWHSVMVPLLGMRYTDAYRAQVIGLMFNNVLPARGGDLLRVQYLGRRTGKSRATILGTEIVDRWLDWWGWIPTFIVVCLVTTPPSWLYKALGIFGAVLTAWAAAMVILTRRRYEPKPGSKFGQIWSAIQTGIVSFRSPRTWLIALFVAPLPWLWETGAIVFLARAFGIDLGPVEAFSVLIGFNLATVVPSPGGIGPIEAGGTAALVFFGVDQSQALALMIVYHLTQLVPAIVTGVVILVAEGERLFGRDQSVSEPVAEAVPPG